MIKKLYRHRFVNASFWVFLATGIMNVGNYLFHVITGRLLGPQQYGVLESVISLLYIVSIPLVTLSFVIIKFVSTYKGRSDDMALFGFYHFLNRSIIKYGIVVTIVLFFLSPLVVSYLHLPSADLAILLVVSFFTSMLSVMYKSVAQGLSDFTTFAISNASEVVVKIALLFLFISIGWKVNGAMGALTVSYLFGAISVFLIMRKRSGGTESAFDEKRKLVQYALPVFFFNLAMTSLFTTDVILIRHFFSGLESGYYAALSVLGKVIFYAVSPIALVMFPLVSEHHAKGERYLHFLFMSLVFVFLGSSGIILIYFFFPDFVILLFFGQQYSAVGQYIAKFGVFIGLLTMSYILTSFYLSIHKTKVISIVMTAAIAQILFIYLFHNSLQDVIMVSIVTTFLLLVGLLLYYPYAVRK